MAEFEIKPDSEAILPHGAGVPYLAIFNSQLSVIRDPKSDLPLGSFVTNFEYVYEEAKVDKGKIVLEIDNPDIVALTELGYQQGLQLQWGWIYADGASYCGPVRKVIITGHDIEFGPQGVKFTIEVSDSSVLLKNAPSSYYDNTKGFVEYVKDLCKGLPIGITLIDYNAKNTVTPVVAKRVEEAESINARYPAGVNTGAAWALPKSDINYVSPKEIVQTPTTVIPDAAGVKLLEYNPDTQKLTIEDPDNFRKVYLNQVEAAAGLVVGTSRSKYYQLQDACRSLSNGPFFVDSRDGNIVIHNVKATRPILKVYTYAGGYGELITFEIKSTFVKSSVEAKETNEINPDSKDLETTFVHGVVDPNAGNVDGKDIDTYMVWPNYYPYLNKPKTLEAGTPKNGTHTNMVLAPGNNKVSAKTETPNIGRSFDSIKEATEYYNTHPRVSQQEIDEYYSNWISDWNSKKIATDADALASLAHELDRIPPFKITRKVRISTRVNLENMGGSRGLTKSKELEAQTETFRNALRSGQIDLSAYQSNFYSKPDADGGLHENSMIMRGTYIKNAVALLESAGATVVREGKRGRSDWANVFYEADITLELNGLDITAGAGSINIGGTLGNDIVESITNQVKAEATVVGDPAIESSMNIQIQNISSKYSGLWYTKKVTHSIGKDGYLCKIEFVQRTVPISTVTLKSNWSKKDYGGALISAAKLAKEEGTYNPSAIEKRIKSELKEHPTQSIVGQVDVKTGQVVYSQYDMVSGDYLKKIDGNVDYRNDFASYIQDLQKEIDKL